MFEQRPISRLSHLVPGLVFFGFFGLLLLALVNANFLPSGALIAYFGPGFLFAGSAIPTALHSSWNGVYVVLGLSLSFLFWWLAFVGIGKLWRLKEKDK